MPTLDALSELLAVQSGVVSRRQALERGLTRADLDREMRHRALTCVHPGVYVTHTGPLTWSQRAWAAVLYAGRAALVLDSATECPDPRLPIQVAIDLGRRVRPQPGLRIHRIVDLAAKVRWSLSPPRVRPEHNVLLMVSRARTELEVVRLLTDVVAGRQTTVARIGTAAEALPRLRHRGLVTSVLGDISSGAHSVLEQAYLVRVERAHGLPAAVRQLRRTSSAGAEYRDAEYPRFGVVVELDGRASHDSWAASGRDADRDLDDSAEGRVTVRLRWRQVFGTPCRTAARIGALLRRRGWTGVPTPCGPSCELDWG